MTAVVAFLPTVAALSRRNLIRMVRMPAILVPMLVMPIFFVIAFTGSFDGISRVEGYPTPKVINWVAAFAMLQGASFAGVGSAGAISNDLENGFMDRLLVSPIRRSVILVAPLVYTAVRACIPLTTVVVVALIADADLPGGALGLLVAYVGGIGGAAVLGCFGLAVVLRMGDIRAMTIVQMTGFMLMFPSIGQVPIALLQGWMRAVARVNPVTNLLRMVRQGFIGDVTWADTWPGLVVIAVGVAVFLPWARYELERRTP
ncbi:MAG: ABC transporter permease [Actinobacteria bacterium]|nr:ABC transporter permease [Actinomycetota bacterium]NIS29649.1 ABC transporter permease [Actinomycetota bacterium]NIT94649.1 ABC transporter permease [Actinomycetota bacterium]NIU18264.1 ABC transporter permease [Actinomycetota bacterium]NIU64973.1 ABC transporter permease [Actinomycetota bacterium]